MELPVAHGGRQDGERDGTHRAQRQHRPRREPVRGGGVRTGEVPGTGRLDRVLLNGSKTVVFRN